MRFFKGIVLGIVLIAVTVMPCLGDDLAASTNLDVKSFTLDNGMLFLVVERKTTPQVACRLAIRAGSALEQAGKTGIAHLLEHMMFKGTKNFGSLDTDKDQDIQAKIEAAYQVVLKEKSKRSPDESLMKEQLAEMDRLRQEVQKIYVPQAFSMQLGRNGAVGVNAFTAKDQTQYIMSVPSDMIEQWFSIVSEQLFEPSWREFYVEKEVVKREWAYRYINSPGGAAWLDLNATAYTAHPYRNPTIGWKSDMDNYNTTDAMAFHKKYYNPTNAVCVLVGDITPARAKKMANIYFARYPSGERAPEKVTDEPPQQGPKKSVRYLKGARTPLVRIGFHAAPMGTEDFYAIDAMTMVLSHGRSARMTQNIVNKGLALQAWAYNPDSRYGGMVIVGGSPKEPDEIRQENFSNEKKRQIYLEACEELEKILLSEIEKLKTEPVSRRELERIKKLNQRDFLDRMRSNEQLAGTLATLEVQIGWGYLIQYLDRMAKITAQDIQRVAKNYIRSENKTSTYVIPGGKPDRPPETYTEVRSLTGSAAAKLIKPETLTNRSIYKTSEGWKHPLSFERTPEKIEYPKAEAANVEGVKVFYLPDRELPLIDLTLLVKAGSVDVEEALMGLTHLINGSLVTGGTETYAPGELAMVLDENAINLSISIGEESTSVHLSVMKDDWQEGLTLLQDVLLRPGFDSGVLNAAKGQAVTALKRQGGNAQSVAAREAIIWHFKGHPYGRDPLKGLETIPAINRDDLKRFLKRYLVPSNMVVAVAGDIDKQEAISGLETLFRSLPKEKAPKRALPEPPETPSVMALIHKPGQVQSQVFLVMDGLKRTHADYWKMSLLMDVFGGNDSLLYKRLRDDLGLVYTAGFYQTYKWQAGMLMGYIGCRGDSTRQAIAETLDIMFSLGMKVPKEEIEQKRLDALNSFVFNVDTPGDLVRTYSRYYLRKEPLDTLERIQEAFISAKGEELEDLARRLLIPKKIQIFVVGDKLTKVKGKNETERRLEEDLKILAQKIGLPFKEIALR